MGSKQKPAVAKKSAVKKTAAKKPAAAAKKPAAAAKKPATAPKKAAGRAEGATSSVKRLLLKSLDDILPRLDEEGLSFLLEQARVHEYNMAVDQENRARSAALERGELFANGEENEGRGKKKASSGSGARAAKKGPPVLHLEKSDDGNTFHFVCEGRYKLFNAGEMTAMLKILNAKVSKREADSNLLAWLERERRDALSDLGVSGEVFIAFLRSRIAKR